MDYYKRQEFPQTYLRCKAYTEQFTDWLVKTAAKREIERAKIYELNAQNAATERPTKNKYRRKKYKVPVNGYVSLAEDIVKDTQKTGIVPEDLTMGLMDLNDAIRSRKEVTEWYKVQSKSDEQHPYFTNKLVQIKNMFLALNSLFKGARQEHDIDEEPIQIFVDFSAPDSDTKINMPHVPTNVKLDIPNNEMDAEGPVLPKEGEMPCASDKLRQKAEKARHDSGISTAVTLSAFELAIERRFQVLCFLYDFNRIRQTVRQTWLDYENHAIGAITAAQITDIAQGVVQRDVNALIEDLDDTSCSAITDIIESLYASLSPVPDTPSADADPQDELLEAEFKLADLLCISGIRHMEEYQQIRASTSTSPDPKQFKEELPFISFLLYFDRVRTKKLNPPVFDNFTRSMISSRTGTEPWLPFGLQIVMDVVRVLREDPWGLFQEITESSIRVSKLLRTHCDYEDDMWKAGIKPEYMTVGQTKFSDTFLEPAGQVIDWLNAILDNDRPAGEDGIDACEFISIHPVLGGMVLYHFHKLYHTSGIQKTGWFIVALSHLYNACRQIGGLSTPWPDLEYIIETQGTKRLFVGERPRDPQYFYRTMTISMAMSSRNFHYERGIPGKPTKWIRPDQATKAKRGLRSLLPIQQKVRDYFYNYKKEDRWIRLHNLFAHVMGEQETNVGSETHEAAEDLRGELRAMVAAVQPKKRRKPHRLKAPDFTSRDREYADLLLDVKNKLREQELHSNFDYLAFFRRGFALVQHIRGEILFDSKQELAKLDLRRENPSNHDLLARLLHSLKIQPKEKNIEAKGDEISKDVVAVEQLQRIAKIMGDLIKDEGRMELDRAEKCLRRWWDAAGHRRTTGSHGNPFGIFHRFTYASTVSRKRRIAIIRDSKHTREPQIAWKPSDQGKHTRLVGKKKTRVAFPCHGDCPLSRACLGRPSKHAPSSKMLLKPRASAPTWICDDGEAGNPDDDQDWETDSDQSDSEYFSAMEELD